MTPIETFLFWIQIAFIYALMGLTYGWPYILALGIVLIGWFLFRDYKRAKKKK